ncbi:MAG: RNA polymerase factor sigma-54 [Lysobacteraceae bacterium]
MKHALQLKLGQNLTLTPQLRQAIRMLQLSSMELEAEINLALESNPLLDRLEDGNDASLPGESESTAETPESSDNTESDSYEEDFHAEWDLDDYGSAHAPGSEGEDDDERESLRGVVTGDLRDHLMWQLNLTPMSARDRAIGYALIEAVGEDGYLSEPLDQIRTGLLPDIEAGAEETEVVLHRIQHFDPVGVAARSLSECLCIQLAQVHPTTEVPPETIALAQRLARDHLETLARIGPDKLATQLRQTPAQMLAAVALLRSLDPRPGAQIASQDVEYVVPDAYAERHRGLWRVVLAPGCRPKLGINHHYESLIGSTAKSDAAYLRGQLQEARWLIRSLETRADTVLRVARCIVKHQSAFLEHGPEAMRPLTLREVAEELELHESTISRVTTRKYLHTPRGTFEFKHFFASGVANEDGGAASSTAIQAMIRRLIDAEDPRKPLSDAKLTDMLKAEGVTVARRTIAKYREGMNIASSTDRQRLG